MARKTVSSTSFHCYFAHGFIVISMRMRVHFGLSWWWWQPLLSLSAVLRLTLTLMASGSVVHLLMGPSSLTVNHLDIRQRQGPGPLEGQSWVHKKLVPRGGGLIQNVAWDIVVISPPAALSSFTRHLFPQHQTEFHRNGDVDRRLQASTNGNSTGDRECLADSAFTRLVSMKGCS